MSATKIVVIFLVLIAVLFVAFVVWGLAKPGPKMTAKDFNKQKPPSLASWFHQVLGSGGPKLEPAQMHPSLTTFDLQKQSSYTIKISSDKHPVRQAELKVLPPGNACAHMVFTPNNPPKEMENPQETRTSDPPIKNRNDVTISIAEGGGTLITELEARLSAPPGTVALQ